MIRAMICPNVTLEGLLVQQVRGPARVRSDPPKPSPDWRMKAPTARGDRGFMMERTCGLWDQAASERQAPLSMRTFSLWATGFFCATSFSTSSE